MPSILAVTWLLVSVTELCRRVFTAIDRWGDSRERSFVNLSLDRGIQVWSAVVSPCSLQRIIHQPIPS